MEKLNWPERLRNIATLLVIVIHVSAPVAMQSTTYSGSAWWAGNLWCSLGRPAVPMFVMLSGFLLFSKTYSLSDFLSKRFSRVIIPALFWIPLYSLYNHFANGNPADLWAALRGVVEGPVHYHLWFLYLIIGLYLTYPIIAPFVRQATEQEMRYFLIVCLFGTWGLKILYDFVGWNSMLYFELFTNNALYFVGGYYLGNKVCIDEVNQHDRFTPFPWTKKQMIPVSLGLLMLGFGSTALGAWYFSHKTLVFSKFFYDYLNPTVTFAAVGGFLLTRYGLNKTSPAQWELDFSAASFGIYLAHPLVRDWWSEAGYWQDKYHPAKCIPVMIGLLTIMSFIAVMIIRVVPGGKKIT